MDKDYENWLLKELFRYTEKLNYVVSTSMDLIKGLHRIIEDLMDEKDKE